MACTVSVYTRLGNSTPQPAFATIERPAGKFVLRYKKDGRRKWETLEGVTSYSDAAVIAAQRSRELRTGTVEPLPPPAPFAVAPPPKPAIPTFAAYQLMRLEEKAAPPKTELAMAIDTYNERCKTRSGRTVAAYSFTLSQFYTACRRLDGQGRAYWPTLQQINTDTLLDFIAFLRATGVGNRTVHNRLVEVCTFLRAAGRANEEVAKMLKQVQVRFVEKKVRSYRPDELAALFAAADKQERELFTFFLVTGARESEVSSATWKQVDFVDKLFTIEGEKSKDKETKEIPLADFLVAMLKERKLTSTSDLIFPAPNGGPDGHMLRKIKALAKRAGITGTVGLHVFRKTYATLQARAGVDVRTIQRRLGHSSLETTLQYLEAESARSATSRKQANDTFGMFAA